MSDGFIEAPVGGDGLGGEGGGTDGRDLDGVQRWQIPVVQQSSTSDLLKHTEKQISDLRQQTYDTAFQQGMAEGIRNGEQQCQLQLQQLEAIAQAMAQPLSVIDADIQNALAKLLSAIVKEVTLNELQIQPDAICQIVEQAVTLLDESDEVIVIHLNPDDAALLQAYMHECTELKKWKVIASSKMLRGDVQVQCGHQFFREPLNERIKRIVEHILACEVDEL